MKKIVTILLVLCMVCSPSGMVFGATASDIENHWGNDVIQNWMNRGLIGGYSDGTFRPDKAITRAEFMAMVNKAFNLEAKGSIHFKDVAETDWYYDAVRAAFHADYIGGYPDGSIKPNHPICRQEVAAILSKIRNTAQNPDVIHQFSDANLIAEWAKGFVGAVVAEGYMSGYPMGTFKPTSYLTRAEAVTVLNKVLAVQISDQEVSYLGAGVFGPETGKTTIAKNVIIKADGVTLQNTVIKGNLIIAEEVGDGDVWLNNIIVEGETFIRGGGKDSIHINGGKYSKITVQKTSNGGVRVVVTNLEGAEVLISEAAAGEEIIIVLDDNSTISKLVADAKTVVQGQGTIKVATGKMVSSSTFEKAPERIILPSGGRNRIEIEAVNITGEAIVGTALTAVPTPSAATVAYQWKSSSDDVTYVNISGATGSTYMPVNDDVGKFIKAEVMGTGSYKGTISSNAVGPVIPASAQTVTASASALTMAAGEVSDVTLTVLDGLGDIDTRYHGERTVTLSGAASSPFGSYGSFNGTELTADSMNGQDFNVTFTSGVAIINLSLHKAAVQTITFSIDDVAAPATNPIIFVPVPAAAAGMDLSADIAAPEISGGLFAQQPAITLKDIYGNICVNDSETAVTAARKDDGDWILTGTKTVTASNGIVSFTDLGAENIVEISGGKIAFTAGSLPEVLSTVVTLPFHALTATAAAFSSTPAAGDANPVTLTVKDARGNIATRFHGVRTVTISGVAPSPFGSYGSFNGTLLTADSVTGQAVNVTFTSGVAIINLSLHKAAAQTIAFSIADIAAPAVNPIAFTVSVGSAAGMYLTTDITAPAINGGLFSNQPVITLKDAYGNLCANDSHTTVTASKKDSGVWTLTGTKTVTASNGVVSFTNLGATNSAEIIGAQIAFTAISLPEVLSRTVTLPFYAQTATASASASAPAAGIANPVTLTVKDALGNVDTTFNGTRAVTISGVDPASLGSYGTFNGTTLTASSKTGQNINVTFTNGVAAPNLSLNKTATQTIAFCIAGVAIPGTNSLSITPVVADNVTEGRINITDPGLQGSGSPLNLGMTLYDKYGNTVNNGICTVTVTSDLDGVLVNEQLVSFSSGDGTGSVSVMLGTGGIHILTVTANSVKFVPAAPATVMIPVWDDASGWFILGDASGGGGGGGGNSQNGARGGNGGGNDDKIIGTDGDDIIFGDGSGGGGGYQGSWGSTSGSGGSGGGGNDTIYGGLEDDIIFGDGFNGASGWNSNRGGFGGGGGGGGGGNLSGNTGGQGGLGAGSGRGYSGNGSILVSGFGNVGDSVATATSTIGKGGSNGGSRDSGYGGGGGFGGSNGGAGGNWSSASGQGQDGNTNPHAYKFSDSSIYDYTYNILGNILAWYPNYGAGNDVLDGGSGSDQLFGLGGNDTFEFRLDSSYGDEDIDTIWDFNVRGSDRIRLINDGVEITSELYIAIIAAQTASEKDRTIVFSNGSGQQITIIVKNLNRDLTAQDFGL